MFGRSHPRMTQRPELWQVSARHPRVRDGSLIFFGGGNAPGGPWYCDSARPGNLNGNHGTLTNFSWPNTATSGWTWIPRLGRFGTVHGGTKNFVDCGTRLGKPLNWTIAAFVNPITMQPAGIIFSGDAAGTDNSVWGIFGGASTINLSIYVSSGAAFQVAQFAGEYIAANWPIGSQTHIAATVDGSFIRYYRNGTLIGSPVAQTVAMGGTPYGFSLGRYGAYDGLYWKGGLSDAGLWNRALSLPEIQTLANPSDASLGGLIEPVWQRVYAAAVAGEEFSSSSSSSRAFSSSSSSTSTSTSEAFSSSSSTSSSSEAFSSSSSTSSSSEAFSSSSSTSSSSEAFSSSSSTTSSSEAFSSSSLSSYSSSTSGLLPTVPRRCTGTIAVKSWCGAVVRAAAWSAGSPSLRAWSSGTFRVVGA